MGPLNKPYKIFSYLLPSHKRNTKTGCFLLLFFFVGGFVICSFFIVVFIFTLFSGFLTLNTEQAKSEQLEASSYFPDAGKKYLHIYQEAGKKYGVPWNVLAAIHKVETDFGRNLAVSVAGAKGHTQFMDKSWIGWRYPGGTAWGDLNHAVDITDPKLIEKYGGYGVDADGDGVADPYSAVDALYSTANFLSSYHRESNDWFYRGGPVWQYNHDYVHYVHKVKEYAERFAHPVLNPQERMFAFPVDGGRITSEFGERFHPLKHMWIQHKGLDIGKRMGAPILAAEKGVVISSRASIGYGWKIVIDHGNGVQSLYAHMEKEDVYVSVGDQVDRGQKIALMGSNGWSTGPHLHFEVHVHSQVLNPNLFLR